MNQLDLFGLLFNLDNQSTQTRNINGLTLSLSKEGEYFSALINGKQNHLTVNNFKFTFKLDNLYISQAQYLEGDLKLINNLINIQLTKVITKGGKIYFSANYNDINIKGLADCFNLPTYPLSLIALPIRVNELAKEHLVVYPNFLDKSYEISRYSELPLNPILNWSHDYKRNSESSDSSIKQNFAFHSAWFPMDQQKGIIVFQPISSKSIFFSPDILDSTRPISDIDNDFLFQHIALYAYISANFIVEALYNNWRIDKWELLPENKEKGMTIATPALKDENGFPLLIRTRERLPLIVRSGNVYPYKNRILNNAIVIGSNITHNYSCQLVSFIPDPQIVLSDQPPQLNEDRLIQDPPWITCHIADKPPREIIGWSRNGVIRLIGREQALSCSLNLNSVLINSDDLPSYVLATIEFSANSTKLLVDLPEKECQPISPDTGILQRLEGIGKLGMNISLPLCDTAWAFADLSGIQQGSNNGDGKSLANEISSILFDMNKNLVLAFEQPKQSQYRHIEGHRAETPKQEFEQLLSIPPITTALESGTGRNWLALAPSETTLKQPASQAESNDPSGTVFLFGGDKGVDGEPGSSFSLAKTILKAEASEDEKKLFSDKGFFPIQLPQWEPKILADIKQIWLQDDSFKTFRQEYGAFFSLEVLQTIKKDDSHTKEFLDKLNALNPPIELYSLDALIKPPDYLVLSQKCRAANSQGVENQFKQLSNLPSFDFCKLSDGNEWKMGFDNEVTFIVKLGGDRSLKDILVELNTTYQKHGTNPFGLAGGLQSFIAQLPAELLLPSWRGVLVVNPRITLDPYLKELCGFKQITGTYAAITGHTNQNSSIDVWGRIDQRATPDANNQGGNQDSTAECSWALVKLEATIKNTTILAGEIQFRLKINELLGKRDASYKPVDVIGTLKAAESNQPRDFSFAASFIPPREYSIDTFFIGSVLLHSVKIGTYKGQAALSLDADLKLKPCEPVLPDPPEDPLKLTNFYILLPKPSENDQSGLGKWAPLSFDLGGIRVTLPEEEKKLMILGFEIKPVGIGILKGTGHRITESLKSQSILIEDPKLSDGENYSYPYLDTLVQFGEDPDSKGENQLSFTLRSGAPIPTGGSSEKPGVGLVSLQGNNIKLSLFGFLTVSAEKVKVERLRLKNPYESQPFQGDAAVAWVDNFNLEILSWKLFDIPINSDNPINKLIFAQKIGDSSLRGILGWYKPATNDKFFRLHWLLLARNFDPGKEVKDALLSPSNGTDRASKAIETIFDEHDLVLKAKLDHDYSWLVGISFSLSSLFTDCALVLHEKKYYGIRLGGLIAKALTGEDVIALAYIPGKKPELSRFRTEFRCPALDMVGKLRSGLMAMEWAPNWDFVLDFGFPWRVPEGYEWSRAFSMPVGVYEAQFGYFIERRTTLSQSENELTLSAGAGFYLGYKYEVATKLSWIRAGIGIYGVLIGSATLALPESNNSEQPALKDSLTALSVTGALGIYAYGEAGVDLWVITARFKVSAQASVTVKLVYIPNRGGLMSWNATLSASYRARVTIGCGFLSKTVTKSGSLDFSIVGKSNF